MLISALEVVGDQNCAANKPCVCDRERKDLVIADLLEYNLTPDNREIFNTMFEVDQTNDGYIMNCSDKHFTKIPKFNKLGYSNQPIVDCLDMTHNQIELITESLFYGLLIRCIDFNYNKIKKISRNGFSGLLYSLLVLKLNNNQLTSNSSFPVYFASKFTQLQALFMASNKFDRIVEKSFQSVFSPRLKILDLSFNQINCIHNEAFNGLSSLHYLNLCNNNLGELDILDDHDCYGSTTFKLYFLKNLVALEHLRLCSNNIENIHGGKENFKSNYKLRILNFHDNRIKNISGLFCYYNENKALNSYLRNLAVLDLSNNNINEIKLEDLSCLHNLQELYLQFNNLAYLTSKSFQNLYSLKVLHINNNPKLVPNPTLFFELRYSLIDLVINFNIENNAPRYEFDRILEVLLIENQLSRMENLVLSNSRFENVHLNLAYALLANHHLKVINCTNCSVKMLKYEFKMRPQDIGKALNIKNKENVNGKLTESQFHEFYKLHICPKKIFNISLTLDLNKNLLSNCHQSSDFVRKRDVLSQQHTDCSSKQLNYIKILLNYFNVKNLYCMDSNKKKKIDWQTVYHKKLLSYIRHKNCTNNNLNLVNCSMVYERVNNGVLKIKQNHSITFYKSNKITMFLILNISLVFKSYYF